MKVLLDTNVVLDVLLQRGPWMARAEAIWQASIHGRLESCITASSLTDIYYISRRLVGEQAARETVQKCLDVLTTLRWTRRRWNRLTPWLLLTLRMRSRSPLRCGTG